MITRMIAITRATYINEPRLMTEKAPSAHMIRRMIPIISSKSSMMTSFEDVIRTYCIEFTTVKFDSQEVIAKYLKFS